MVLPDPILQVRNPNTESPCPSPNCIRLFYPPGQAKALKVLEKEYTKH